MKEEETDEMRAEGSSPRDANGSKKLIVIVASVLVAVLFAAFLGIWYMRSGNGGRAVEAPKNVTFGDTTGGASPLSGDETITIRPDQIDRIGLKIETVGEMLSKEAMSVAATGVVQPNAYRETPAIALLGGVVRSVRAELGENVQKGSALAVVFSDEFASAQSRYITLRTDAQAARQNYDRASRLVNISPVSNNELSQSLAALKGAEATLVEARALYERTQKLVAIGAVSREEMEQATTKLRTAEAAQVESKERYGRAVKVAEINPVSRSEFEQAAVRRQAAESDLAAARQRLLLYGLSSAKIDALRSPSQITSELTVAAPVSGTVTSRAVNAGEAVEANKEIVRITDLANVWVIAQVYEKDLPGVREGSGASITSEAFPDRLFRGRVTYIDPNIKPETRTAQVRIELDNPGRQLRIGMYVNAAFGSTGVAERTMPVVASGAVQNLNDAQVVFVATERPNVFLMRRVRLLPEENGRFPVVEGLKVGDRIVTDGSFLLRAEWQKLHPNG
ncbi:MAG: efflux RND transporter periplasmic adaptor subunit [Chloracidobacterium sp.]|nr:efflux RND transporter periplasmic adaptor subunit [Chloracidobacterium sp.]